MKNIIRQIKRSLFARLLLIFLLTAVAISFVIVTPVHMHFKKNLGSSFIAHISNYADYIMNDIGTPPNLAKAKAITQTVPLALHIAGPNISWSSSADFPPMASLGARHQHHGIWIAEAHGRRYAIFERNGYSFVFATAGLNPVEVPGWLHVAMTSAALLILLLSYLAVKWLFRPIQWLKQSAERIGQGELEYRIPAQRSDELGELTQTINNMAADIEKLLEAKRQLLLAISHELRSPLTRMKVSLEMLPEEKYKRDIADDVRQMEKLIAELMESERLNSRHSPLQRENISLNMLIDDVIAEFFGHAKSAIKCRFPHEAVNVNADPARIKLLLKNLIDNALRHSRDSATPVEVTLERGDNRITLTVTDHGYGIPAELLPHITEPFYRADASRQRETGGIGLGLYLCQLIVNAHNGSMQIISETGKGTAVQVQLPAGFRPE